MRVHAVVLFSSIAALALCNPAISQEQSQEQPKPQGALPLSKIEQAQRHAGGKSVFDDPLGGIVVNRTVTVLGNDFYQYFSNHWREKDISSTYTISIHERPSARFGSEIWVQFRHKRMFHTFLPPARAATKDISAVAVDIVYQNITDSEVERILTRSPDLGPEEM